MNDLHLYKDLQVISQVKRNIYLRHSGSMLQIPILKGRSAFFFFFRFPVSPSFGAPEFTQFCLACYELRKVYPSLTVSALRTILTVARADGPLTYQELADLVGHPYVPLAHQIAALSNGRDKGSGLGLLSRQQGNHARARVVTCSDAGLSKIQPFIIQKGQSAGREVTAADILSRTLKALIAVLEHNPKLTLGSLCVYLFIATHKEEFAYFGEPVKIISRELKLSNLPKHLKVLEIGAANKTSLGLIGFHTNEYDQRIRLPFLTQSGIALQCALVTALSGKEAVPPKVPRAEALDALDSPADVPTLAPDDFDDIVWE